MAYTIYEYDTVNADGDPVEPPSVRTAAQALGVASAALAASTVYVAVVPDADMYLRISTAGTAATSADQRLEAGQWYGFSVSLYGRPKLYGLAATDEPLTVLPPFSRAGSAGLTFTPGGDYSGGEVIYGVLAVDLTDVDPALVSAPVKIVGISATVKMASNTTPGGNTGLVLFNGEPSGSFTDGAAPAWAGGEIAEIRRNLGLSFIVGLTGGTTAYYGVTPTRDIEATTDAEGKLYFVWMAGVTTLWGTPGDVRFAVDFLY